MLAFFIRRNLLPLEVRILFGAYGPSQGHGMRTRLYRECLFIRLQDRANPYRSDARWPGVTKTTPAAENKVHKLGGTDLSKQVERVLCQGPKFAVEPKKSSPELLSMTERCVSEGVDVLMNCKPSGHKIPLKSNVSFLIYNNLSRLPAYKEGGFVVAPKGMFLEKASDAIYATFSNMDDVSLSKVKPRCSQGL
ncbi:hypothetical protein HPB47_018152 [Ixodes persulcatus]|uniref:Uncharacterized protein n=1 Tax=Ixodes persulcatus TaxID=34615 RepID=A0AC60QLH7_IXOPE|nr:hypothetical protein HPB47_018152 [Ixodes persulcatus]